MRARGPGGNLTPPPGAQLAAQGLAAFQAGDYPLAEKAFRGAYAAASNDAQNAFHLASALCALGRLGEAAPLAWQAYAHTPSNADFTGCMKYIVSNFGLSGDEASEAPAPWSGVGRGNALRQRGRFADAEAAYRDALAVMPGNLFLLCRVGAILCNQRRFADATPYFHAASAAGLMPEGMLNFEPARLARLTQSSQWKPAAAPVLTQLARPASGEFVFLLSCDPVYFERFAIALVNSVARNAGVACTMHFHVLNSDARVFEIARTLIKRHESVAVVLTHESIDTAKLPSSKLLYACARFILLPALMEYYRKPVIVLDLDALVMRDLGALLRTASHASVAVPLVNQGRGEPTETLWAALVCFSTQPAAHTLAALAANYILEEIACGRGYWFLDQAALLAVLAHANALPETEVLLLPEHVLQCTDRPEARLVTDADDLSSCFWTVAASVPAHAGRIEHPAFRAYCD